MALAPGFAILLYVYYKDRFSREPASALFICFILGMVAILPAWLLESGGDWLLHHLTLPFSRAWYAFGVVAVSEEGSKYFFLRRYAYKLKSFDEPFDGIVYSVFIGMGFATLENILYVMTGGMGTALWRMFTAVPAHATFAVLMGHYAGLAKLRSPSETLLRTGLLLAVLFHGAYDYFLFLGNQNLLFLGAFVSLIVGVWLSFKAIRGAAGKA